MFNCNLLNPVIPAAKIAIIDKIEPYITEEDKEKYLEIAKKMQAVARANDDVEIIAGEFVKFFHEGAKVRRAAEDRYIKSKSPRAIMSDVKTIIAAIAHEDFLAWIKGAEEKSAEPFENCYCYIRYCLLVQIRAMGEDKIRPLIEKRVIEFGYTKPEGLYIPPIMPDYFTVSYGRMRSGPLTSALARTLAVNRFLIGVDKIADTADFERNGLGVSYGKYEEQGGARISTLQLQDEIIRKFTERGGSDRNVIITLDEHMKDRGLKNEKAAREQLQRDVDILYETSIYAFKGENFPEKIRIVDKIIPRRGFVVATIGASFYEDFLSRYSVIPISKALGKVNGNTNPHSYFMGRLICELKYLNRGKKNEDIIAVKTLISAAPKMPSYEEVITGNRSVTERIIKPFERDMDELEKIGMIKCWEYCHSKGTPLTDEELEKAGEYATWINLLVKITMGGDYPALPARRKRKGSPPL